MDKLIVVQTEKNGEVLYYREGPNSVSKNDNVIVETDRGIEFGHVICFSDRSKVDVPEPIKSIIRVATESDYLVESENIEKEKIAYEKCLECIQKHELEMKLVRVRCLFDGGKILFYFTAEGRVDFRALVRDLAAIFRIRIELRQIGARDEAKMVGGIGICGRVLCCTNMLKEFSPVSIKMAKEQNLPISPTTVTGCCGRLKCCLAYENHIYEGVASRMPKAGDSVIIKDTRAKARVVSVSLLKETIRAVIESDDESEVLEYTMNEVIVKKKEK